MKLIALPAFEDNYIWMVHDGQQAMVVDPGESVCVQRELSALGLRLSCILVTHSHPDHIGGLHALTQEGMPVYGPVHEAVAEVTQCVRSGDLVRALGLDWQVLDAPGHTRGHIAYFCAGGLDGSGREPILFAGDTLFSAGCGRVFDGTMEDLHQSLLKLAELPDATLVCAAHEYTLSNLKFARAVEPGNASLDTFEARCRALRSQGLATLPSTIVTEKAVNPFLRCTQSEVIASAVREGASDAQPQSVFAALRQWKNRF